MQLPALDFHTAFGMTALSAWALVGVFWILGRRFWTQGIPYAMASVASFGMAYLLLALQHTLPYVPTLMAAHLCLSLGMALLTLCYQRFGQHPWRPVDTWTLVLPLVALALTWAWTFEHFARVVQWRGALFMAQLLFQMAVLLQIRRHAAGKGWLLVLCGQVVQMVSLLPMVFTGERPVTGDLQVGATVWGQLWPWVACMVMFLNLQVSAYGYLLMLSDRQHDRERKAAGLDGLTQLASRRTFMEQASAAMQNAQQQAATLGMLVMDIDHFKRINDGYGHLAGDAVIQRVAWVLRNHVRQQDLVARYGGEEFVVLMPDSTPAMLLAAAQRIADAVRQESVPVDGQRVQVTVSMGGHVQQVCEGLRWEELLAAADAALYEAKHAGRDRVVLSAVCRAQLAPAAPEPSEPPARRGPEAGERRDDAARR